MDVYIHLQITRVFNKNLKVKLKKYKIIIIIDIIVFFLSLSKNQFTVEKSNRNWKKNPHRI